MNPQYGGTEIERPTKEEKRQIWSYVHHRQEKTEKDQWVTGSNGKNNAKLHFMDNNGKIRCMKKKIDRPESWSKKGAYVFPFDYRDLCLQCVRDWRNNE